MPIRPLSIAMLSIHSSPIGRLGTRNTGGMSVYVRALAGEMGRLGHGVDIFTGRLHGEDTTVVALAPGVRLVTLDIGHHGPLAKADLFAFADDYRMAIEVFYQDQGYTYDLIHSHYWISGQVGRLLSKRRQRPHLITFHTLGALKTKSGVGTAEPKSRLAVEKKLVRECDGLLAPCEGEKTNLMHYYEACAAAIAMVPGGVDLKRFRPMDKTMARTKLGVDTQKFMLLCVGRLTPLKGQERVIDTLSRFTADDRPQLILVGGDGDGDPEQQRLQRLAARLGVQENVRFAGSIPQHDLPAYYAAADACVLASHYESFGLVGVESLACGRPVVTTPVGIMKDLGRLGRPGVLLADHSPAALAAGIAKLKNRMLNWPVPAICDVAHDYSWTNAASAALEAYHRALEGGTIDQGTPGAEHRSRPI